MIVDEDQEAASFDDMQTKDQTRALFNMMRYVRAELANLRRDLIDFQGDLRAYRRQREQDEQNTTAKIKRVLGERFDFWVWFRDKVMPNFVWFILMALMYLAFQRP